MAEQEDHKATIFLPEQDNSSKKNRHKYLTKINIKSKKVRE